MLLRPLLPRHNLPPGRQAAHLERVLAVGRAFLTVTGLMAIYLDPTEPARLREVTYGVLSGYAVYSVVVLAFIHGMPRVTNGHAQVLHGLDILWTSALTVVSEGPISPFFLFFLFVVLAAAYRWGFRETVGTAVVTVAVFLFETAVTAVGPWSTSWLATTDFELNRTILRVAYLLLTGVLLGYLAEQEKQSRAEVAALADAARQPHVHLGLGGSVTAVARTLLSTFNAAAAALVVRECETRRTLLWQFERHAGGHDGPRARRVELGPAQQATWLFDDPGRVWSAIHAADGEGRRVARVTEPSVWPLKRESVELPAELVDARAFRTVTAVNLGLAGEWQARAYLFDVADSRGLERRLHFLEAFAEHVTPALTNVFLLRRLRSRASAAERARVARELHDGAIQALFGIELKIEAMRRESRRTAEDRADLAGIQDLLRREVLSLRELMQALRPIEIESGEHLPDVLAGLVERFRRDTGISARFMASGGRISLPPAKALELVRIVQEALANVRKHSQAQNVLVRLTADDDTCRLVVEDDGRGFDFEGRLSARELDERRVGPAIIKERARIAGAELAVDSAPGAGTRLEVALYGELHA